MYMYMSWRDSSLNHSSAQHLMVNDNDIRNQMLPDLYFANAKTAQFHHVTIPNFSMFIAKDGTIAYSCR
uniref:Neur_chan_LBD domain-containing protein n=1 Tax=Ascaris lumbricoides TaxID=6252 RepID=A0A0M3HHH6_ASCLU